ncbi:IclR family transcriptional regulator [Sphaerisporangium perillae]|uniref:IclR family transcriptional regulator n=1 Tax=Sphaerisporangium perillae TaxID=2935860 RepID=UPI00200E04D6|nr:IclR family transcriptional regulator [Sphaerisporangium perillae]
MAGASHRTPGQPVTTRTLSALDAFDGGDRVLSLSQIARRTGLPVATAHRMLGQLCAARLLAKRHDGLYEIGARMWRLGLLARPTTLREAALPHLHDLVIRTGHTVHLAVLDGFDALVIDRLAGSRTLPTRHSPGGRLPLHCTAVGKVLLAHAPASVQERVLTSLQRHTPYTITDRRQIERQMAGVHRTNVARSAQEHREGTSSVAMPVSGTTGVIAAVGVIAPLTSHRFTDVLTPLSAAAAAVSASARDADFESAAEPERD